MTLAEQAYLNIRRDIVTGALPPALPLRLDALKARYKVGYSPLREALNRLQAELMVVSAPLRGFSVAPISPERMWDTIETRILIESQALRQSMARGGDVWETEVVSALHSLTLQARRIDAAAETDEDAERQTLDARHRAFHRALLSACGSEWLMDFADKLYTASQRYRFPGLAGDQDTPRRDLQQEHAALAEAALARMPDDAIALLVDHYRRTGDALEQAAACRWPKTA